MSNKESKFNVILNDSRRYVSVSKEEFRMDMEGLSFDYHYMVETEECDGDTYYTLSLVPTFGSIAEMYRRKIEETLGSGEPDEMDVYMDGIYVPIETFKSEGEGISYDKIGEIEGMIDRLEGNDRALLGLKVEKPLNLVGWTGMYVLDCWVNGKKLGFM